MSNTIYLPITEETANDLKTAIEGTPYSQLVKLFFEALDKELDAVKSGANKDIIEKAQSLHEDEGTCEIDDNAIISESDNGAYVMAWVWVGREDEEDDEDED